MTLRLRVSTALFGASAGWTGARHEWVPFALLGLATVFAVLRER